MLTGHHAQSDEGGTEEKYKCICEYLQQNSFIFTWVWLYLEIFAMGYLDT